jgi:hypothetical protein
VSFLALSSIRAVLANLGEKIAAFLLHNLGQAHFSIVEDRLNALDVTNSLRNHLSIFVENGAQSVHQFCSLMNNTLTRPEQDRPSLLISGLWLDKAHFRLTSRNDDCLSIGCVILLPFH